MNALETLRARLPEAARDIGLNVSGVLGESSLGLAQKWGVAYATALAARNAEVAAAVKADAEAAGVEPGVLEDARVAAAVMAMNNVYYRFRHFVGKETYSQKPARLRMTKLAKPATNKADLELFCLAVSAVNGCEQCVRSHEDVILRAGLSEEQVHDAVRVGATMTALATSLEFA
jgi:alkyl hydroperoxide reductase subunit D